jgi:hypothetical protein
MSVKGTDVDKQECFNFDCDDTQISCPPEGYEACPGGTADCNFVDDQVDDDHAGERYNTHQCQILPSNDQAFKISCLKEPNGDGTTVCYYNQGTSGCKVFRCYSLSCLHLYLST